jgi:hypothetical protein
LAQTLIVQHVIFENLAQRPLHFAGVPVEAEVKRLIDGQIFLWFVEFIPDLQSFYFHAK